VKLGEEPFTEILRKVTYEFLEVNKYEEVSNNNFLKHNVDIMFVAQNPDFSYHMMDGFSDFSIQSVEQDSVFNKFPVIMNVINDGDHIHIDVSYNKSLYKEHIIKDFSKTYIDFLKHILSLNSELDSGYKDFFYAKNSLDI
jgi:surfactin family lipopeptide synthetase A